MRTWIACGLIAAALAGCGGGGGDSTPAAAAAPLIIPIAKVDQASYDEPVTLASAPKEWRLNTVTGSPIVAQMVIQRAKAVATTFRGAPAISYTIYTMVMQGGQTLASTYSTVFARADGTVIATVGDRGEVTTTTAVQLPATATVGQSGPHSSDVTVYGAGQEVVSTGTYTWRVAADTATTAAYCVTSVIRGVSTWPSGTVDDCIYTDAAGTLNRRTMTVSVQGRTLTFVGAGI